MSNANGTLVRTFTDPLRETLDTLTSENYAFLHLNDVDDTMGADTFLKAAYKKEDVREIAVELAKIGYYVYRVADGIARFVREDHIATLWHLVREGTYQSSKEGLIYSFQEPTTGGPAQNLVVIFSSISGDMFGNGLSRYFTQNYKSLNKHLPGDTAILRIADVGGLVGSFYLDTKYAPENTKRIASLIESTRINLGLEKRSVIAYGASKGATGALYHAHVNGYSCVCVEPVINDHYYETAFRDSHFTADGVFEKNKEAVFTEILEGGLHKDLVSAGVSRSNIVVIYSDQSPQAPYIESILGSHVSSSMTLINYRHPRILDHPDVSPQSLNLVSMYMNLMCYKLPITQGRMTLDCLGTKVEQAS